MSILTRHKPNTQEIVQKVLEQLPAAQRSHRVIDLDRPIELNPRPLIELKDSAIKRALQRLLTKQYFDICLFDSLIELAGIYPPKELYKTLRPLHCDHWIDMEPDFRNQIQQHIIACFIPVETQE